MRKALNYLSLLLLLGALVSCKKFLDVRPDSNAINPNTVEDFERVLNQVNLASPNFWLADLASDDVLLNQAQIARGGNTSFYINTYKWEKTIWGASEDDAMYNYCYEMILQMNIVLDKIGKAFGGTPGRKEVLTAQAKINRAYYYLQLVNLYGKAYQVSTAGQDLAVPLILHPDATAKPLRATTGQVYAQLLSDLNEALNTGPLPDFGVDVIHPGKAAAFALLARTYLYMGDFDKALSHAESALNLKSDLLDYTTGKNYSTLEDQQNNPEIILARVGIEEKFYPTFSSSSPFCSKGLAALFGDNDLRLLNRFDKKDDLFSLKTFLGSDGITKLAFNYSLGVPEMLLVKAECLARKGQDQAALTLINELRKKRITATAYSPLTINGSGGVLSLVLEERRRELFLKGGLRLFDLKRLILEGKFSGILERRSTKDDQVIASLAAGSGRYIFPFAPKIIINNPLIIQNER